LPTQQKFRYPFCIHSRLSADIDIFLFFRLASNYETIGVDRLLSNRELHH